MLNAKEVRTFLPTITKDMTDEQVMIMHREAEWLISTMVERKLEEKKKSMHNGLSTAS